MIDHTNRIHTVVLWKLSKAGYDHIKSWGGYRNLEHAIKLLKRVAGSQSSLTAIDSQFRIDLEFQVVNSEDEELYSGYCSGDGTTLYTNLLNENPEDIA